MEIANTLAVIDPLLYIAITLVKVELIALPVLLVLIWLRNIISPERR